MTSLTNSRLGLARWLEQKTGGEQQVPLKQLMERCHNKPFYCNTHPSTIPDCCTWHIIIPPPSNMDGLPSPLHPFQQNIISELEKTHRIAVVKARNLGLTALALRYALHLTLSKQIPGNYLFVTGVGYILSSTLARRVRKILKPHGIYFDDNQTTLTFPHCRWGFYGSDSGAYRGQTDVPFVLCDELSEFESDPMAAIDTYSIKNRNAFVWLITTPSYDLNHFSYRLFSEPDSSKVLYKRLYLDYTVGLSTMLDPNAIALLKQSSLTFSTEYELQWGGGAQGNLLTSGSIAEAFKDKYSLNNADYQFLGPKAAGVDHGGINTAICILCYCKPIKKIRCLFAKNWSRPDTKQVSDEIWKVLQHFAVTRCWLDGSNIPECTDLMERYGDPWRPNYHERIKFYKGLNKPYSETHWVDYFHARPVNFSTDAVTMLQNLKLLFDNSLIQFHPDMVDMRTALVSAQIKDGYQLDKSISGHDLIDAARLACKSFQFRRQSQ